jgi:hypothetical protein
MSMVRAEALGKKRRTWRREGLGCSAFLGMRGGLGTEIPGNFGRRVNEEERMKKPDRLKFGAVMGIAVALLFYAGTGA